VVFSRNKLVPKKFSVGGQHSKRLNTAVEAPNSAYLTQGSLKI
jgi:hypothetical protein